MVQAESNHPRIYTIHGPPGVSVAALLRERAVQLTARDVLLIAEHDEATHAWLECEPGASEPLFRWERAASGDRA